jgi:hypothetical protein
VCNDNSGTNNAGAGQDQRQALDNHVGVDHKKRFAMADKVLLLISDGYTETNAGPNAGKKTCKQNKTSHLTPKSEGAKGTYYAAAGATADGR